MKLQEYLEKYGNIEIEEKQLNELLGVESKGWKPKNDETFYYITYDGNICCSTWKDDFTNHSFFYEIGNCFKTKKEARFAIERLKTVAAMERYAKEHNEREIDWCNILQDEERITYRSKFYITYDCKHERIYYCSNIELKHNDIYFTSQKVAEDCVKAIGEERIKKYYLCVEE